MSAQILTLDFNVHKTQYREYITVDGDKVIAKMTAHDLESGLPYAADLFVAPDERKKGHAKRLAAFVEDDLIADGFKTLALSCRKEDEVLLETYQRMGFKKFMESDGGKFIYMAKELS